LVTIIVFANGLSGEFVYDDNRQILRNPLIQDNSLIGKALASDVWAFKGDGSQAASNYWRPTFTAWNIFCFRLFGTNPFGWHLLNLLLHVGVCALAYMLLRRWNLSPMLAFAISLVFSVHPIHVESVTWIAGLPDLLFSLAFLGSLWFAENYAETKKTKDLVILTILYAIALGAKEIGILCLPIYWLIFNKDSEKKENFNFPLMVLVGVAIVYFLARLGVIGAISRPPQEATSFGNAILSIPSIFTFYLRQAFFPLWLSANYPLRPVDSIGFSNFILPLLLSTAFLVGAFFLAKRTKLGFLGLALFLLPLLPAMNATAFIPEQIAHDRYLYLPILGILLIIFPLLAEWLEKFKKEAILFVGIALSLLFSVQTFLYNQTWLNDLAIWQNAVKIDEHSSFTWQQLGAELSDDGKFNEAVEAYQKSINVKETQRGLYGLGVNLVNLKKYNEAENFLNKALNVPEKDSELYAEYQIYESLAIALTGKGNYVEAEKKLLEARQKLPMYSAALTEKLAIIYYQQGKKNEALKELESVKTQARKELLPESKFVLLRLGMLYFEQNRKDESRAILQEFLKATENFKGKIVVDNRTQATNLLKKL
jgi:tetratricopeptide (TPR) repeat protein